MNKPIRQDIWYTTHNEYKCDVYYNKGYDVEIWVSPELALPIITYHNRLLLPYLRASKTLMYPIVNIPKHGEQFCHLLVNYSIKGYRQKYEIMKRTKQNVVVDHKDGNVFNYNIDNLRYLTHNDNISGPHRIGYMRPLSRKQFDLLLNRFDITYEEIMNEKIHSIKLSNK